MLMFNDCFTVARPCVAGSELAGYMEAQAAVAIYLGFQEPTCRVHTEGADAMVSAFQGTGYCGLTLGPLLCAGAKRECRTTQAVFQSKSLQGGHLLPVSLGQLQGLGHEMLALS